VEFVDGFDDFGLGVHDIGAIAGDWFVDGFAAQQEQDGVCRCGDVYFIAFISEEDEAVFGGRLAVDGGCAADDRRAVL
jgi:hypothetical protein